MPRGGHKNGKKKGQERERAGPSSSQPSRPFESPDPQEKSYSKGREEDRGGRQSRPEGETYRKPERQEGQGPRRPQGTPQSKREGQRQYEEAVPGPSGLYKLHESRSVPSDPFYGGQQEYSQASKFTETPLMRSGEQEHGIHWQKKRDRGSFDNEPMSTLEKEIPQLYIGTPQSEPESRFPSDKHLPVKVRKIEIPSIPTEMPSSSKEPEHQKSGTPAESNILSMIPTRASRPRHPKSGKKFIVETNHFPIMLKNPNMVAYQYDVTIKPESPKFMYRYVWNEFVARYFPRRYPSYDGKKIAYSAGPLMKSDSFEATFQVDNRESMKSVEYKVGIKLVNVLQLQKILEFIESNVGQRAPSSELSVIDVVLRNKAANLLVSTSRCFYTPPRENQILSLGNGMEMWYGFYQSAIMGWKFYLNFDISHKGFPSSKNIIEVIKDVCLNNRLPLTPTTQLNKMQIDKLNKFLKTLKVEYVLPQNATSKRIYRVNAVRPHSAMSEFFEIEEENSKCTMNVVQYYSLKKNYVIQYPELPCLWVGSVKNKIYVPCELCCITPGQVKIAKLDDMQTSKMIRYAAQPPKEKKNKIVQKLREAKLDNEYTKEFGISVSGEFEKVEARVLDPPRLKADGGLKIRRGQWDMNKFLVPRTMSKWCVLNTDSSATRYIRNFEEVIRRTGTDMGMKVEFPWNSRYCEPHKAQLRRTFDELKSKNVELVFVIVSDRGETYSLVKQISELQVGVMTQCVRVSTLEKSLQERILTTTFSNILLKVNTKLNGVNHCLDDISRPSCLRRPIMIMGADVTHPSPDATNLPSIVAVASSFDPKAFRYYTIRKLQPPRLETIQDMEKIMKEHLLYFYREAKFKPERIIVFRDGVSEGQVEMILREELNAIRKACRGMQSGDNIDLYQPKITFVIVQKRHHTRFYPLPDNPFCDAKNPNVPAGTCVDSNIVHPRDLDFYLVSHSSRLGTARPTKYKLIYDDSDMSESELETLAYYLCHLISRCNKSISYPAPTYYAHLAAFRARAHLQGEKFNFDSPNLEEYEKKYLSPAEYFTNNPMFFV